MAGNNQNSLFRRSPVCLHAASPKDTSPVGCRVHRLQNEVILITFARTLYTGSCTLRDMIRRITRYQPPAFSRCSSVTMAVSSGVGGPSGFSRCPQPGCEGSWQASSPTVFCALSTVSSPERNITHHGRFQKVRHSNCSQLPMLPTSRYLSSSCGKHLLPQSFKI